MAGMRLLSSHGLWCRILQIVFGIVCFGLAKKHGIGVCNLNSSRAHCQLGGAVDSVAIDGYALLIAPILLIGLLKSGAKFQWHIINPLFDVIGCALYIAAGSVDIRAVRIYKDAGGQDNTTPLLVIGAMCIITGILYLISLLVWIIFKVMKKDQELD